MASTTVTETVKQEANALADERVDSTDSEVRYMAYAARLRTALRASTRYIAYTSDIGEAFRPVVPPWIVTTAYGVSWLYLAGDVGFETWKAKRLGSSAFEAEHFSENTRLAMVATKRSVFQSVASMALPAFTIHTIVKQSAKAFVNTRNPRVKAWGPTVTGLAVVPLLPFLFDHPVEQATDRAFDWLQEKWVESRKSLGTKKEL